MLLLAATSLGVLILVFVTMLIISATPNTGPQIHGADDVSQQLQGVPQHGFTLGALNAPITLIEYGDLQCHNCRDYAEGLWPQLISGPVRDGNLKIEFRNFPVLGADSFKAAEAAEAASFQDKLWNFIELFYKNQRAENSGYVTTAFLKNLAEAANVEDIGEWSKQSTDLKVEALVHFQFDQAISSGLSAVPIFILEIAGTSEFLGTPSTQQLLEQINQAVLSARLQSR